MKKTITEILDFLLLVSILFLTVFILSAKVSAAPNIDPTQRTQFGSPGSSNNPIYTASGNPVTWAAGALTVQITSPNADNAIFTNYAIPYQVTPLVFDSAAPITITPISGKSIVIEGVVIHRTFGSLFYMSDSYDNYIRSFDPAGFGTIPLKIVFPANTTVYFYSNVTNIAHDAFGEIWYREK
jgi:hypothetical protein